MIKKDFHFDDILLELGLFGRFQILKYLLLLVPVIFNAIYNSQYVFNAGAVPYRCSVPECEAFPPEWEPGEWGPWALPDVKRQRCERWEPREPAGPCLPDSFNTSRAVKCTAWIYSNNHTIVSEFNLACREWKRTLVGTVHSAGVFFALPIIGIVSDTYGRRITLVITAMSSGVMGLIRSFSTSYGMYLSFEFLDALLGSGSYQTSFVLALEMVDLKRRVWFGNTMSISFAVGQVVGALIAWAVPEWRTFTRVIYTPALFFFLYYFILHESVRWLLSKGKKMEAAEIILKVAKSNKKKLSPALVAWLTEKPERKLKSILKHTNTEHNKSFFVKVLRSRVILCRLVICSFWWITVTFIYYGLSINSVTMSGNGYVNYILTSLAEIPGYILSLCTLDRFGRKGSIMLAFFTCGIALIIMPFIPNKTVSFGLTLLGKVSISMVFVSIYIYTIELFPTEGRASLMSVCSTVGRIGSMTAPQTPLLMEISPALPYYLFGTMAGCAGVLMMFTPETLHLRLPDSIKEAETIAVARRTSKHTNPLVDASSLNSRHELLDKTQDAAK